jgi:hypothetical protein
MLTKCTVSVIIQECLAYFCQIFLSRDFWQSIQATVSYRLTCRSAKSKVWHPQLM